MRRSDLADAIGRNPRCEVGEQHLDLFAIVTGLRIGPGFGECAGNIACLLIDVTIDPPRGRTERCWL